jgi:hypothetical protein
MELLERADVLVTLLQMFSLPVNYWKAQNIFYSILKRSFPLIVQGTEADTAAWIERFLDLGEKLRVSAPKLERTSEQPAVSQIPTAP